MFSVFVLLFMISGGWFGGAIGVFVAAAENHDKHALAKGLTWPMMVWKVTRRYRFPPVVWPESFSKMWDDELEKNSTKSSSDTHVLGSPGPPG